MLVVIKNKIMGAKCNKKKFNVILHRQRHTYLINIKWTKMKEKFKKNFSEILYSFQI